MSPNPVQHAYDLVAQHRTAAAVAVLETAGAQGDSPALAELATWHLRADPLPRDLPRARALLRRAVQIGHVDAALTEIALTANGSGAAADWPAALRLLEQAAMADPVAAEQLAMVRSMTLDAEGRPAALPSPERLSSTPDVIRLPRLFTSQECFATATAAADLLAPATIVDPVTGATKQDPIRTSDGASIDPTRENLVIRALNARIAAASGTTIEQGEPLSVLRYGPGQQYREHLDTITGAANQRVVTVLVYLNDGFVGGETIFPHVGLRIAPRAGDAIVFRNTRADGRPDPAARHAGVPVTRGTKWLATRWIRAEAIDPWRF